jgi:hypothetical protein
VDANLIGQLSRPFDPKEVKWKPAVVQGNRALALAYIDARVVQDRLDEVLGVENWQDDYEVLADNSVVCNLRLRLGEEWLTKVDVGSPSEQPDGGDRMKAAFSDALKRAAVKFGVGRYLYRLPSQWVDYDPVKRSFVRVPSLPPFALPKNHELHPEANSLPPREQLAARQANPQPPRKVYCSQQQQDALRNIADDLGLDNDARLQILRDHGVKRVNMLTPDQCEAMVLRFCRRRVGGLLTELGWNLDDVRERSESVTADTADELDQDQANAALTVLRQAKERTQVPA